MRKKKKKHVNLDDKCGKNEEKKIMSSKVFSRAVKLIMCCILKRMIQGKERKQALCLFIFKGRVLNSTVLKALYPVY